MAQRPQTREERLAELAEEEAWLDEQEQSLQRDEALLQEYLALHQQMQARRTRVKAEEEFLKREKEAVRQESHEVSALLYEEEQNHPGVHTARTELLERMLGQLEPRPPVKECLSYETDDTVYVKLTGGDGVLMTEQYVPLALIRK